MARRATPVTKGRTTPKKSPAATRPARAAKSKPHDDAPTETPEDIEPAQPMLAGVDEPAPAPEPEPPHAPKAKRGRKSKPESTAAEFDSTEEAAPTEAAPTIEPELELSEPEAKAPPSPRKTRRNREPEASAPPPLETSDELGDEPGDEMSAEPGDEPGAEPPVEPPAESPAAVWHSESGTVTFDWPAIEHVAATEGANQPMAKLLLAARAEGARSRWPF